MSLQVFVIGPMVPRGDGAGAPHTHTLALRDGVRRHLEARGRGDIAVRVPDAQSGSGIVTDVFRKIDSADLVVADLSGACPVSPRCPVAEGATGTCPRCHEPRPNVMYEIAFAHALGLPMILVTGAADAEGVPFYLKQSRVAFAEAMETEALARALAPGLDAWLGAGDDLTRNPLKDFYGAAVVDISAAAGLAAGYFESYVVPIMRDAILADEPACSGILVVLPERLDSREVDLRRTRRMLEETFGAGAVARDRDIPLVRGRRDCPFFVDGVAIDLPRTLYTLTRSPRYRRMLDYTRAVPDEAAVVERMERSLVAAFADSLPALARGEPGVSAASLDCAPIGDADALAKAVRRLAGGA